MRSNSQAGRARAEMGGKCAVRLETDDVSCQHRTTALPLPDSNLRRWQRPNLQQRARLSILNQREQITRLLDESHQCPRILDVGGAATIRPRYLGERNVMGACNRQHDNG